MTLIKKFTEKDSEFRSIVDIYNMVSHDEKVHIDEEKEDWSNRDKSIVTERLLLYIDNKIVGFLRYSLGKKINKHKCFFNIFIDPRFNNQGFRQLLYGKMLDNIKLFNCDALYMEIYDHVNYKDAKSFLIRNGFVNKFKIREFSLELDSLDLDKYSILFEKLNKKGIKFFEPRYELPKDLNHYTKLEKLHWLISKDFPLPEGLRPDRDDFEQFLKDHKFFQENRYGVEIIATFNDQYIAYTDLELYPKADPEKVWTGGLGVLADYRRQGIATALKVKALSKLKERGIKVVRTDNEKNNPMYLINVAMGFKPEPYGLEYQKAI